MSGLSKDRNSRRSARSRRLPARSSRRGVLLLVVLSMLVLFMLIGTAFLMTSSSTKKNADNNSKNNRRANYSTRLLDRALLQVLRDTDNPNSVVRYHSLLRDMYGGDGFQGVIYSPVAGVTFDPAAPEKEVARFADATAGTQIQQLGPTQGQFIDIYVRQLGWNSTTNSSLNDPATTSIDESSGATKLLAPDLRHILKLEQNALGQPQLQTLPLTNGYYNGCLLTITSGPAAGQTARIIEYKYWFDVEPKLGAPADPTYVASRMFRFRVMAFQRADGQPLQINSSRPPELADLAGATFIVNGRAFGGTGVGYNPLAASGQPRLNALELFATNSAKTEFIGAELALLPNSVYFNPFGNLVGAAGPGVDPWAAPMPKPSLAILNDPTAVTPFYNYPTYVGPGDANEPYDAADFQNMGMGLLTATPRAQARVVTSTGTFSIDEILANPGSHGDFLRLNLEDLPLPSFHRPDLTNYWYHRLLNSPWLKTLISSDDQRAAAILDPYPNGVIRPGLDPGAAAMIMAIKRQSSLRPLHEDNPNFNGSNPRSVIATRSVGGVLPGSLVDASKASITYPFWEAVGPWDVDNDNDGVADSVWVDLGDPVQEAEDGTRYKALYAFLIIDLDSRLNVNAHGLADDVLPPELDPTKANFFDPSQTPTTWPGNLAHVPGPNAKYSTLQLPRGMGYGPAEISLRPVFPAPLNGATPTYGNRNESATVPFVDSYAAIMGGRIRIDNRPSSGRYGTDLNVSGEAATAGTNYKSAALPPGFATSYPYSAANFTGERATPDLAAQMKFFDYPWSFFEMRSNQSGFGTAPDVKARYALGLDYTGQPVYEVANDRNPNTLTLPPAQQLPFNLLAKSPYELNLSGAQRRDNWAASFATPAAAFDRSIDYTFTGGPAPAGVNDDAPFSPTDLEKVLRAWDADSGTLPSRLWDCANEFDPLKLYDPNKGMNAQPGDPYRVQNAANAAFGSAGPAEMLAASQQIAGISRRLVTTESSSLPVANQPLPTWVRDSAARYIGTAGTTAEEVFRNLTGAEFSKATLLNLLTYRFQEQRLDKHGVYSSTNTGGAYNTTKPAERVLLEAQISQLAPQLLAADVIAGQRMDINRPFGNGRDDVRSPATAGDGVVDDPLEAGEPFLDVNGNGRMDYNASSNPTEPFIDLNGDGKYQGPIDQLWPGLAAEQTTFDYTNGIAVPLYQNTPAAFGVRNLESQGRQQYARQLYCLMLLLVDEGYAAPPDNVDPQMATWLAAQHTTIEAALTAAGVPAADVKTRAEIIARRKLACRMIAQWAINCVDMRDPDVIMTPFEYDENPWDGWGSVAVNGDIIPIDGDPATDENKGEIIDWANIPATGSAKKIKTIVAAQVPTALDQTRGLVWGTERPELLITETLAFHDRRTEDLEGDHDATHKHKTMKDSLLPDPHPDQRLRPKGSLFVEIYNPNTAEGQLPAELYREAATPTKEMGVDLSRLSTQAAPDGKKSPVWRLIVVEEDPKYRNDSPDDDVRTDEVPLGPNMTTAFKAAAAGKYTTLPYKTWKPSTTNLQPLPQFRPSNLDFDGMFNLSFLPKAKPKITGQPYQFEVQYPYIEREFYFTTDNSPTIANPVIGNPPLRDVTAANFNLHIPKRVVTYGLAGGSKAQTQHFIPSALETAGSPPAIAPILPGRYGIIGSAGAKYSSTPTLASHYTTLLGRLGQDTATSVADGSDTPPSLSPTLTRRIELNPNVDPNVQQMMVASNGGDPANATTNPLGRSNELIGPTAQNIYTQNTYQPCVTIPVENMNVSEPPWGWAPLESQLAEKDFGSASDVPKYYIDPVSHPEGQYMPAPTGNPTSFDTPFDLAMGAMELSETGTTANYRTIHLQRLANPLLPWNPNPGETGYDATMPINPYRTVDLASVDLTAFNGVSRTEAIYDANKKATLKKLRPFGTERIPFLNSTQIWNFSSRERGSYANLEMTNPLPGESPQPQRSTYANEPATGTVTSFTDVKKIRDGRKTTMQRKSTDVTEPGVPTSVLTSEKITESHMDMVLEHTLGFGNKSYGALYDRTNAPSQAAIGAPMQYTYTPTTGTPTTITSTYPWLAWNNRPYVSTEELLAVPAASNSALMQTGYYSNINPAEQGKKELNPYGYDGVEGIKDKSMYRANLPFGHLLNFFATAGARQTDLNADGTPEATSPPGFYRILDYVQVPSRYVGTDTVLNASTFNDDPFKTNSVAEPYEDIGNSLVDPRYNFQPPFNKVSRQRDPGRVNLNTVTGRHVDATATAPAQIWSEVYDGIMHRTHDANPTASQLGQSGPAWRDVVLSRRGYAQIDAAGTFVDKPAAAPDTFEFGLNNSFPTIFANPFRSADAADLVPLPQMRQYGADVTLLRKHPYDRGADSQWGPSPAAFGDARDAGFGADDKLSYGSIVDSAKNLARTVPSDNFDNTAYPVRDTLPLFSELRSDSFSDTNRNPYMMYQPMTRLGNLVTDRSGAFAIWITVGYFEVEKADDWASDEKGVQARFGGDINLYNRAYPEGYRLGRELGSDTGDIKRARGFYIIDRTEEVGFKPGEDLNVEKLIRLRRRIE